MVDAEPIYPDQMITSHWFISLPRKEATPGIVFESVRFGAFAVKYEQYDFIVYVATVCIIPVQSQIKYTDMGAYCSIRPRLTHMGSLSPTIFCTRVRRVLLRNFFSRLAFGATNCTTRSLSSIRDGGANHVPFGRRSRRQTGRTSFWTLFVSFTAYPVK
jgi:hypothetical protein